MRAGTLIEKAIRRYIPFLYNPLLTLYQRLFDADTFRVRAHLRTAIARLESQAEILTFVQVGSNDGFSNDPFCRWVVEAKPNAYFFEPVPSCFALLVSNYREYEDSYGLSNLHFFNEAVSDEETELIFYSVSDEAIGELGKSLPYWWNQLGSFDRGHITKHLDGILEPFIVETKVKTVTLQRIVERENLNSISILHIDAEGHDFRILKSLNFSEVQPQLILIEVKHLSSGDRVGLFELLNQWGYRTTSYRSDLIAEKYVPLDL